jgi:hypothetical protein
MKSFLERKVLCLPRNRGEAVRLFEYEGSGFGVREDHVGIVRLGEGSRIRNENLDTAKKVPQGICGSFTSFRMTGFRGRKANSDLSTSPLSLRAMALIEMPRYCFGSRCVLCEK